MIRIVVRQNSQERLWSFSLEGHAMYSERGKDIVCAGVSVLVQSIFNGLTEVLGYHLDYKMKDGFFSFDIPDKYAEEDERVKVLLDTLLLNLRDLEKTYNRHIKLIIEEVH